MIYLLFIEEIAKFKTEITNKTNGHFRKEIFVKSFEDEQRNFNDYSAPALNVIYLTITRRGITENDIFYVKDYYKQLKEHVNQFYPN